MKNNKNMTNEMKFYWFKTNFMLYIYSIKFIFKYVCMLYDLNTGERESIMMTAATCGNIFIIRLMLIFGVSLKPSDPDFDSQALFYAVSYNRLQAAEYLIKKRAIITKDIVKLSIENGCGPEMVELLLKYGGCVSCVNEKLLDQAFHRGDHEIVKILLIYGADRKKIKAKTKEEKQALENIIYAVDSGY